MAHSARVPAPSSGETDAPRKPSYDFERREREAAKASGFAKKAQVKADKRAEQGVAQTDELGDS